MPVEQQPAQTAADVLDVVGGIGAGVATFVPGPAGVAVGILARLAGFIAQALRGGLSPEQAITRCQSALAERDAIDEEIDAEITRRTT